MSRQWNVHNVKGLQYLFNRLTSHGYEAYLVGGAVRSALLNLPIVDYDVASSASPNEVMQLFEHVIPTGIAHGTVTVMLEDIAIEVTTFRSDGAYSDGRRPDQVVFASSIQEDLARRDFTMNAMAIDKDGALKDPFNGLGAVEVGIIAAVGDPVLRMGEDRLRKLRAFRFQSQLGFKFCPHLQAAIKAAPQLDGVSGERIKAEMDKLLMGPHVEMALSSMVDLGVLDVVMPELSALVHFDQGHPAHRFDAFTHTIQLIKALPEASMRMRLLQDEEILKNSTLKCQLIWAALYHDAGKPFTKSVDENGISHYYQHQKHSIALFDPLAKRLKFSKKEVITISAIIDLHMLRPVPESRAVRRWINRIVTTFGKGGACLGQKESAEGQSLREVVALMLTFLLADKIATGTLTDYAYHDALKTIALDALETKAPFDRKALRVDGHQLMMAYDTLRNEPQLLKSLFEDLVTICLDDPEQNQTERLMALTKDWIDKKNSQRLS
mgnify:CR=1 FL=1